MATEFLMAIYLAATAHCHSVLIPHDNMDHCVEYVKECMLDGESGEWCLNDYLHWGKYEE